MLINKEFTNKYYENYIPCNCGDCRYFIKHIETEKPELCEYLRTLGINPLKPFELMSIYYEKDKRIEYFDCAYVAFGIINESFEKEVNGIKLSTCPKDRYPLLDTDEEYFLISFGHISINCAYGYNRLFTFNDKVQIIKKAIDEVDPMGLLVMHCPKDEYIQEATIIAKQIKIKKANFVKGKYIQEVFKKQFDVTISMKKCNDIARRIIIYLDMKDFFKFDDKRIVSILWLFISLCILILSICAIKVIEVFVATLFVLFITVLATIFTFNEGIHFNYKKEKIIIVKGMMIKSINMKDVKYFSLEKINKTKKGNLTQKLVDTYDQVNMPSKYVYNNGKVFNIVFYMKNIGNIKVYYGWLYKTRSIERINSQLEKFKEIKENFMKYKNNKLK